MTMDKLLLGFLVLPTSAKVPLHAYTVSPHNDDVCDRRVPAVASGQSGVPIQSSKILEVSPQTFVLLVEGIGSQDSREDGNGREGIQ